MLQDDYKTVNETDSADSSVSCVRGVVNSTKVPILIYSGALVVTYKC